MLNIIMLYLYIGKIRTKIHKKNTTTIFWGTAQYQLCVKYIFSCFATLGEKEENQINNNRIFTFTITINIKTQVSFSDKVIFVFLQSSLIFDVFRLCLLNIQTFTVTDIVWVHDHYCQHLLVAVYLLISYHRIRQLVSIPVTRFGTHIAPICFSRKIRRYSHRKCQRKQYKQAFRWMFDRLQNLNQDATLYHMTITEFLNACAFQWTFEWIFKNPIGQNDVVLLFL